MAKKHSDSERVGGPGAAHENRKARLRNHSRAEKSPPIRKTKNIPEFPGAVANTTRTTVIGPKEKPGINRTWR
jgi:hypothetical protein